MVKIVEIILSDKEKQLDFYIDKRLSDDVFDIFILLSDITGKWTYGPYDFSPSFREDQLDILYPLFDDVKELFGNTRQTHKLVKYMIDYFEGSL